MGLWILFTIHLMVRRGSSGNLAVLHARLCVNRSLLVVRSDSQAASLIRYLLGTDLLKFRRKSDGVDRGF